MVLQLQWCQTNFSFIEDVENCQIRGGFSQKKLISKINVIVFCTLETGIFGLISEGKLMVRIRQIETYNVKLFENIFS
jgi:hypothetical protein